MREMISALPHFLQRQRSPSSCHAFAHAIIATDNCEQSDAGDPLGCAVVGSILFNMLSVCGMPLPGRLILGVLAVRWQCLAVPFDAIPKLIVREV